MRTLVQQESAQEGADRTFGLMPDPIPADNAETMADANAAPLSREREGPPDAA